MLIPGLGHQGGDLSLIAKYGFNDEVGVLVNCSRSILYASNGDDFFNASMNEAKKFKTKCPNI